jgi:WD40 repeat protein
LSVLFDPAGRFLLTTDSGGLHRWDLPAGERPPRVGAPENLTGPLGIANPRASLTPDGRWLALLVGDGAVELRSLDRPGEPRILGRHPGAAQVAISPDGKWVASGTWGGVGLKVWDARAGGVVHDLPVREAVSVAFSPDGRWLVAGASGEYRCWSVGDWVPVYRIAREPYGVPGPIAFTADGRLMALGVSQSTIHLVDPASGRKLAALQSPGVTALSWLSLSADGGLLAAGDAVHAIHVWDLRAVRQRLVEMGLDWEQP